MILTLNEDEESWDFALVLLYSVTTSCQPLVSHLQTSSLHGLARIVSQSDLTICLAFKFLLPNCLVSNFGHIWPVLLMN